MPASLAHPRQSLKAANAALFASIEERFGVPPGPLIAIWGMETGFGTFMGNQETLSAIATLAYDYRRPEYFTEHLYAALKLVDRGVLDTSTRGMDLLDRVGPKGRNKNSPDRMGSSLK